jgi:uncharacterized phage-associated protein
MSATVFDVARYILEKQGSMTHMKLQKLVYYSQAWGLVWDDSPLFEEEIEAWVNGPVAPELYQTLKGKFTVSVGDLDQKGDSQLLSKEAKETVDAVLAYYGKFNSQYLSDLTHMEKPWKAARDGLPDMQRGNSTITHASMAEYYGAL